MLWTYQCRFLFPFHTLVLEGPYYRDGWLMDKRGAALIESLQPCFHGFASEVAGEAKQNGDGWVWVRCYETLLVIYRAIGYVKDPYVANVASVVFSCFEISNDV